MSAVLAETSFHPVLDHALEVARAAALPYAGSVRPRDAWDLVQAGAAVLVDVRSAEERKFVGHVPGVAHVAWASGTSLTRNPRFVRELEAKVRKDETVLLLCRSGKRSALAAEAATKASAIPVFPLVGSISSLPGTSTPRFSASQIIAAPIRHFTE